MKKQIKDESFIYLIFNQLWTNIEDTLLLNIPRKRNWDKEKSPFYSKLKHMTANRRL